MGLGLGATPRSQGGSGLRCSGNQALLPCVPLWGFFCRWCDGFGRAFAVTLVSSTSQRTPTPAALGRRCVAIPTAHSLRVAPLWSQGRDLAGKGARGLGVTPVVPRRVGDEGARSCLKAEQLKCWCPGPGVNECSGSRDGWEGRMQIQAGNGDRGLFGTLASAPWR